MPQRRAEARTRRLRERFGGTHSVITGGSAGIGAAVGRRLVEVGGDVTLVARHEDRLAETAERLRGVREGAVVRTIVADVADQAQISGALDEELSARPADLLVNSAGISHAGRLLETDPATFRRVTDVDYLGTVWTTLAAVPHLRGREHAHIVNVASIVALEGVYGYGAYAPSKFAVLAFSQVLRAELRPQGVGVSVVLPPNTDTEMLEAEMRQLPAEMRPIHSTSRVLPPEAVADGLLAGVCSGRFEIIPGRDNRVLKRVHQVSPTPLRASFDLMVRRELRRQRRA
ncbi:MAG TPA: SDR family oxidoreductase [Solirubrobacteraceae bacterium]|nr:SDR family oxidoreductase [Solirubrobacteraceae bacterium]